jgi:hypothetical protein
MTHNVYFWLKTDMTADQVAFFETELKELLNLDYISHGSVGKPAKTEDRPVTDHSFSYTSTLHFKTMADHEFYQNGCPKHKRFVDNCRQFFDRVVVYDSDAI